MLGTELIAASLHYCQRISGELHLANLSDEQILLDPEIEGFSIATGELLLMGGAVDGQLALEVGDLLMARGGEVRHALEIDGLAHDGRVCGRQRGLLDRQRHALI